MVMSKWKARRTEPRSEPAPDPQYLRRPKPLEVPSARAAAALAIAAILGGRSLNSVSSSVFSGLPGPVRAQAQALCFATLREYGWVQALTSKLIERGLREGSERLLALIWVALTELRVMATPDYAAVDAAVNAARELGATAMTGLVNAVLRRFLRERELLLAEIDADESVRLRHPAWLLTALKRDWPEHWPDIVDANLKAGPMWLRLQLQKGPREAWIKQLGPDLVADAPERLPEAVRLIHGRDIEALPGFRQGWVSVQDAAGMQVAHCFQLRPGMRVLDACAAPGGKTAHLLELEPRLQLLALDRDAARMKRVKETLSRLQLQAQCRVADARELRAWSDGLPFDAILVDAPCSGTGVIRRHPDILWLRRESDVATLVREQRELLDHLWSQLKRGGQLLYATCSILAEENQDQVRAFLAHHRDAFLVPVSPTLGFAHDTGAGRVNLPGEAHMDGFFIALLEKR